MKLLMAIAIPLVAAILLVTGIIFAVHGKPALLIGTAAVYLLGLAKIGCASH